MNLTKYKKEDSSEVAKQIAHYMCFSDSDRRQVEIWLQCSKYHFVYWDQPKKSHFLYRIMFPLYVLFYILVALSLPVKWLFTGTRYYKKEDLVVRMNEWWVKKLNL